MESLISNKRKSMSVKGNNRGQAAIVIGIIGAVVAVLVLFIVMGVTGFVNESFAAALPVGSAGANISDALTEEITGAVPLAGLLLILSFVVGIIALLLGLVAFRAGSARA